MYIFIKHDLERKLGPSKSHNLNYHFPKSELSLGMIGVFWQQPASGWGALSWVSTCYASIQAGTNGLHARPVKPSHGGPAHA